MSVDRRSVLMTALGLDARHHTGFHVTATSAQSHVLRNRGVPASGLTLYQASALIGILRKREQQRLSSPRQVVELIEMGRGEVEARAMTRRQAFLVLAGQDAWARSVR